MRLPPHIAHRTHKPAAGHSDVPDLPRRPSDPIEHRWNMTRSDAPAKAPVGPQPPTRPPTAARAPSGPTRRSLCRHMPDEPARRPSCTAGRARDTAGACRYATTSCKASHAGSAGKTARPGAQRANRPSRRSPRSSMGAAVRRQKPMQREAHRAGPPRRAGPYSPPRRVPHAPKQERLNADERRMHAKHADGPEAGTDLHGNHRAAGPDESSTGALVPAPSACISVHPRASA
jgi:hypothetical protein